MNSKFFDVKKEKQDNIINAALRLFTVKGYKDASTDVIVKEAGISKGLLFHYFISKKGLYEFIVNYSTKYMTLELTRSVRNGEKDFFNIMSQIEAGKTRILRHYPYMHQFLRSIRFENDPEAVSAIGNNIADLELTYSNIYSQIDSKKLINPDESAQLIDMIEWINDGFMKGRLIQNDFDCDICNEEFAAYLNMLKKHFYKSDDNNRVSIAKEELIERNEIVMDEMKMEMTFEERLMNGKKPLVDMPENEETTEVEEQEKEETAERREDAQVEEPQQNEPEEDFLDDETVSEEEEPDSSAVSRLVLPTVGTGAIPTDSIEKIIAEAENNLSRMES